MSKLHRVSNPEIVAQVVEISSFLLVQQSVSTSNIARNVFSGTTDPYHSFLLTKPNTTTWVFIFIFFYVSPLIAKALTDSCGLSGVHYRFVHLACGRLIFLSARKPYGFFPVGPVDPATVALVTYL